MKIFIALALIICGFTACRPAKPISVEEEPPQSVREYELDMQSKCTDATIAEYLYTDFIKKCSGISNCVITPDVLGRQFELQSNMRGYCTR